jgi:hypothetical protein
VRAGEKERKKRKEKWTYKKKKTDEQRRIVKRGEGMIREEKRTRRRRGSGRSSKKKKKKKKKKTNAISPTIAGGARLAGPAHNDRRDVGGHKVPHAALRLARCVHVDLLEQSTMRREYSTMARDISTPQKSTECSISTPTNSNRAKKSTEGREQHISTPKNSNRAKNSTECREQHISTPQNSNRANKTECRRATHFNPKEFKQSKENRMQKSKHISTPKNSNRAKKTECRRATHFNPKEFNTTLKSTTHLNLMATNRLHRRRSRQPCKSMWGARTFAWCMSEFAVKPEECTHCCVALRWRRRRRRREEEEWERERKEEEKKGHADRRERESTFQLLMSINPLEQRLQFLLLVVVGVVEQSDVQQVLGVREQERVTQTTHRMDVAPVAGEEPHMQAGARSQRGHGRRAVK